MKYFIVSDVHSFFDELMIALNEKGFDKDNPDHILIVCGDLFDRGPKAVELLSFVQSLGERFFYVRGNHEDLIFDCYKELQMYRFPSSHHQSNGTIDTLCQLTGLNYYGLVTNTPERKEIFENKLEPILDWINYKAIDSLEFGDYICVHGWIPCFSYLQDFRNADESEWKQARWLNGMNMWMRPENRISGKTIICGHWHCSWGWSHIKHKRKEFPQKNRKDWLDSFEPFIDDGIMAIDACTAYTGKVNCIVIEE